MHRHTNRHHPERLTGQRERQPGQPFTGRSESDRRSRGIGEEDAVSMIVDGFCKQVFRELPMEFAVEAKKLLEVSLEGAIG